MTHRRLLYAILAVYVVLASIYSIVTPIFEASDELWHYPAVQYIATHGFQLPPQTPGVATEWRQEGSQPPLYYLLTAALTMPINTSDLDTIRRQNPHADIGVIRPDGNVNMIVHHTNLEAFPWQGTTLAVHVARFFSVILGLGTVIVTYRLARELFPNRPEVALGAAALNAFLPMFLFISGSVNNDNLSNLLGNLLTLLIVILLKAEKPPRFRFYALIGVVAGAGLLAKLNVAFLIPLVALALLILTLRFKDWRPLIVGGLISGALTIGIAGWWYLRNDQLYGDPTGLNTFLAIVGRRDIPANLPQLWAERSSFTQAFWGFFGGVNVPLPNTIYLIFNIIGGIGLISAVVFILYKLISWRRRPEVARRLGGLKNLLPYGITVLWITITFVSYLQWTAITWASQGRLIFGALSAILIWMVIGWTWFVPQRLRGVVVGMISLFFLGVAIYAPFGVIAPAYEPPPQISAMMIGQLFNTTNHQGTVGLEEADLASGATVHPGEYVTMNLYWGVWEPFTSDWSLFVHLVSPDGVIVGQRDVYPGGGTLATSDLPKGYEWESPVSVYVPDAAYAPMTLSIQTGWYNLKTGDRLTMTDVTGRPIPDADGSTDSDTIGTVDLQPRASDLNVPNPISVNFDHQIELVGYQMSTLTPKAGDSLTLTLDWRALQPISSNYTVFAHILDPQTTTIYAGSDDVSAPTSSWKPGEIITDAHTLTVKPDTPPGIYEVEIGLYLNPGDGTFPRLRIVTPDGGMADDHTYLSRVRVLPREDGS